MYVCTYWGYLDRLAQFSFKASLNEGHIKARPQHRELRSQLFANQPFAFSLSPSYFSVSILFTPILLLILSTSLNWLPNLSFKYISPDSDLREAWNGRREKQEPEDIQRGVGGNDAAPSEIIK